MSTRQPAGILPDKDKQQDGEVRKTYPVESEIEKRETNPYTGSEL